MAGTLKSSVGIRWGLQGVASTTWTNAIMQSTDSEVKAEESEIKNSVGETVALYLYNKTREVSFTFYVGGASNSTASAIEAPAVGDVITVSGGSNVSGSAWIAKSVSTNSTNTDAVKIVVKATEYTGNITS